MNNIIKILMLCVVFNFLHFSQNKSSFSNLKCILLDSLTLKPIELANFVLLKTEDSSLVTGAVSNSHGDVTLNRVAYGDYLVVISYIGYRKKIIQISINKPDFFLDTIRLSPTNVKLNQVDIIAKKEIIEYKDDKIVFNVEKDIFSQGGSAILALENAPLVHVDINENIRMIGKRELIICIDGISLKDMGQNPKEFLQTLPSFDIEKIEIYTSPPPEYSSSLDAGVINIILKKSDNKKYSGLIRATAETRKKYSGGVSLSYKLPKGNLRSSFSGNYAGNNYTSTIYRWSLIDDIPIVLNQTKSGKQISFNESINLNYYFPIDKQNTLIQVISYKDFNNEQEGSLENSFDQNDSLISYQINNNRNKIKTGFFNYFLSYNRTFEQRGQRLNIGLSYVNNLMDLKSNIYNNELVSSREIRAINFSSNRNISYLFKSQYNHPFGQKSNLFIIANSTIKNLYLENNYYNQTEDVFSQVSKQKFTQINFDIIPNFSSSVWGLDYSITLGLSGIKISNLDETINQSYKYNYTNIYPGLRISHKLNKNHTVRLNGGIGALYPLNKQLNPHVDGSDSSNIETGNPSLKPSKTGSVSLGYNYLTPDLSCIGGFYILKGWDNIERYTVQLNSQSTFTTYRNAGEYISYNGYIQLEQNFFSWLKSSISAELNKMYYKNSSIPNDNLSWGIYFDSNIIYERYSVKLDFSYIPSRVTSQSKTKEYLSMNLGGRLKMDNEGKFYLFFTARDLLNVYKDEETVYSPNFISVRKHSQTTRSLEIRITYFFQATDNPGEVTDDPVLDDF